MTRIQNWKKPERIQLPHFLKEANYRSKINDFLKSAESMNIHAQMSRDLWSLITNPFSRTCGPSESYGSRINLYSSGSWHFEKRQEAETAVSFIWQYLDYSRLLKISVGLIYQKAHHSGGNKFWPNNDSQNTKGIRIISTISLRVPWYNSYFLNNTLNSGWSGAL